MIKFIAVYLIISPIPNFRLRDSRYSTGDGFQCSVPERQQEGGRGGSRSGHDYILCDVAWNSLGGIVDPGEYCCANWSRPEPLPRSAQDNLTPDLGLGGPTQWQRQPSGRNHQREEKKESWHKDRKLSSHRDRIENASTNLEVMRLTHIS